MRKKIFTLLLITGCMTGGSYAAQAVGAKPWDLKWDTTAMKAKILYEDCVVDSIYTIPAGNKRVLKFDMTHARKDKDGMSYIINVETGKPFQFPEDSIILPASTIPTTFILKFKHRRVEKEEKGVSFFSFKARIDGVDSPAQIIDYKYRNHPTVGVSYSKPSLGGYNGIFKLTWKEGYEHVYWSVDNGQTWRKRTKDENKLNTADIASLPAKFSVIIKEPNGCETITVFEQKPIDVPGIARYIDVVNGTDAKLEGCPTNQFVFVNSGSDFSFTIIPSTGKIPHISTSRNNNIPDDKGGVIITPSTDGKYLVTIPKIRENLKIKIMYKDNSTVEVDDNKVWVSDGLLYITSPVSGNAKVYNMLGSLNKMITFSAGETSSFALPAGIYVVSLSDGKTYKVSVR